MTSDYTEVNGRVVKCWYEIGSMYFDAPESITLVLEGCSALSSDHSQNVFNLYIENQKISVDIKVTSAFMLYSDLLRVVVTK